VTILVVAMPLVASCIHHDDPNDPANCGVLSAEFRGLPASVDEGEVVAITLAVKTFGGCSNSFAALGIQLSSANASTASIEPSQAGLDLGVGNVDAELLLKVTVTGVQAGKTDLYLTVRTVSPFTTSVPITVTRAEGSLAVTIVGLPATLAADVRLVQGPTEIAQFPFSAMQPGFRPGAYTLNAGTVRSEGANSETYAPTVASQPVSIERRNTTAKTVTYVRQTGSINLAITGLPAGVPADVQVFRALPLDTISRPITASIVLTNQSLGVYTIQARTVVASGVSYVPTVASQTTTVSNATTSNVSVTYVPQVGSLGVSILGIEGPADVDVLRGSTLVRNLAISATLLDLPAGGYTINARSVDGPLYRFEPTPTTQVSNVVVGAPGLAFVTYTAVSGALNVTITGLPAGLDGRVLVTPAGNSNVTIAALARTTLVPRIAGGNYAVLASPVTTNAGVVYLPTPTTTPVTIVNGRTTSVDVVYAPVVAPRISFALTGVPSAGSTTLTITGGTLRDPVTVTATGATPGTVPLPIGIYTVRGDDITVGNSTYQPITRTLQFQVTATENQTIVYSYFLAAARYRLAANIAVLTDPYGHRDFVQMPASITLNAVWTWASPTALPVIAVTGNAPWIAVSGTRNADGTAVLTGSGSAANFSGVAARLSGTFSATSNLSNGQLQLGSTTQPTGLPNGPITYTINAAAIPASP
jgi:hypothetical protein